MNILVGGAPPCVRKDFVDYLIALHTFRSGAETYKIAHIRGTERIQMSIEVEIQCTCRSRTASEVRYRAVNPRLAVNSLGIVPGIFISQIP